MSIPVSKRGNYKVVHENHEPIKLILIMSKYHGNVDWLSEFVGQDLVPPAADVAPPAAKSGCRRRRIT